MKVIITGASGFVGQLIVPQLKAKGCELLLVGRVPTRLKLLFPGVAVCDYSELAIQRPVANLLLHLAVLNNDKRAPLKEVRQVNVNFALEVAAVASEIGVGCFVNVSSLHALDAYNSDAYSVTKREAAALISDTGSRDAVTLYLPIVYGERFGGKLGILNRLPRQLAARLFRPLSALKATVHIDHIVNWIVGGAKHDGSGEVILTDGQRDNTWYLVTKRLVDLAFAISVIVLFWWMLAAIWLSVRLSSPGPGIFKQQRIGRRGRCFTCYKFRTMQVGTKIAGTHEVTKDSVTPVGQFLRRTKLDELPQIWNILRNEVSLIGPRPCLPVQEGLVDLRMAYGVLDLKPGITGLAQVNGVDMSNPLLLARLDALYGARQSILTDLQIAVATAMGRGMGDSVAR